MNLLETIKCNNGNLENLNFHQDRFSFAREMNFSMINKINLTKTIQIPEFAKNGLYKCRIVYNKNIAKIEFIPHQIREIKTLKLVTDNDISYKYKTEDRKNLKRLYIKRENCDDILIVKNGCLTDSYTANIILFNGSEWHTPDTPLLCGTQREKLIKEKKISICRITVSDLVKYQKIGLINAMQNMEDMPIIPIQKIFR
jgi:4-amino-4-deoxychorismate lyase